MHARHGRKISLVGWSLGGLHARELAKLEPDLVRSVVSLGSPFAGSMKATNAYRLFQLLNRSNSISKSLLSLLRRLAVLQHSRRLRA